MLALSGDVTRCFGFTL